MARKSARLSGAAQVVMATHKRAASTTAAPTGDAKRSRTKKATPTKSPHFKDTANGEEEEEEDEDFNSTASSDGDEEASEFEGQSDESAQSVTEEEAADDSDSEEDPKPAKKRTLGRNSTGTVVADTAASEAWKPGVKAGLGPGKQLIIKKPKARPAGKTPYTDDTVHPNTMLFLSDLKANNKREWLKMHDPDFRQSERDWHSMVEALTEKLTELDDTIPELPVKDVVFRIYRDVRFSKDQTPYKPHFSAAWSRTGRKGPYACYYVQIAPNNQSFVGGGLWHPEAAPVAALRRAIDRRAQGMKGVLMNDDVRKAFLDNASNEAKAVKAFCKTNAENALKSKPKGFNADHPDIALLRLRNYTIGHKLTDEEVLGARGMARITELMTCLKPFVTYLNSVVMPDEPESSDGENSGDDSSNDEDA